MNVVAVIPARYGSTRLPGKPLANRTGKPLIQHVHERVCLATRVPRVLVATDDERIVDAVRSFGGEACLTRRDHPSGTDRVAEAASTLSLNDDDLVLNVQGDEPEISPQTIDRLIAFMDSESNVFRIGTAAAPFRDDGPRSGAGSPMDPNGVKVVVGSAGQALYFSRSLIPYPRDTAGMIDRPSRWLLHLGLYAFRPDALRAVTGEGRGAPSRLETAESLEQLRWLERGYSLGVVLTTHASMGIDTPEQYTAFVERT